MKSKKKLRLLAKVKLMHGQEKCWGENDENN